MCHCNELLTQPVINEPYQGKTVRKATILNPRMRMFFNETTHPREISIKPNFCPWCGDKLNEKENRKEALIRKQ